MLAVDDVQDRNRSNGAIARWRNDYVGHRSYCGEFRRHAGYKGSAVRRPGACGEGTPLKE